MKKLPLNRDLVEERLHFIESSCESLERFVGIPLEEFISNNDNYRIVYYDLYTALEATLDIGAHLLSRLPGKKVQSYKDIALFLAERRLFPRKLVENKLVRMAGYRNRITHFYHRIGPEEIYEILKNHLDDFTEFRAHV